ncbi:MAG: GtrA family protein [Anaerolineae bacterium]|nr:GtrA family protein [Anaerolineae bacterium]
MIHNSKERNRFLKFAVVGSIGAVIDFGVLNLLKIFTPMNVIWASVFSFTAAVVSNFFWNRYWTFPESKDLPLVPQLVQFSVVSIAGLLIRTPLFAWLNDFYMSLAVVYLPPHLFLDQFTPDFLSRNGALATVILIIMLWNFFVNRFWTFKDIK